MASRTSEIRMILLSDNCCDRGCFIFQYCHQAWHDLRYYGPCHWDDFRKQTVIDNKVYLIAFEEESPFFVEDTGYFNARNANPPDGYIVLYDVTRRESLEFAERAVAAIVQRLSERPSEEGEEEGADATSSSGSKARWLPNTEVRRGTSTSSSRLLPKALSWNHRKGQIRQRRREAPNTASSFTLFPRLPHELQLAILRECLTSPKPVLEDRPHLVGININVLRVSKFFHEEGMKIYRNENRFLPRRPVYLVADTSWVGTEGMTATVPEEEGRRLADRHACLFYESSSKSTDDVKSVVDGFVRDVVVRRGNQEALPSKPSGSRRKSHVQSMTSSVVRRMSRIFD